MAAVDNDLDRQMCGPQGVFAESDTFGIVIGTLAAAQDTVRIGVSGGAENSRQPVFGDAEKMVEPHGGVDSVDGGGK